MKKVFYLFLFSGILSLFLLVNFSFAAEPDAPRLTEPSRDAPNVSLTPRFRWEDVGAEWYHLYVDGQTHANLLNNFYQYQSSEALEPGTVYQWGVRACNSNPAGGSALCDDSESRFFTTISAGGAPTDAPPTVLIDTDPSTSAEVGEEVSIVVMGNDDQQVIRLNIKFGDEISPQISWHAYACTVTPCTNLWRHAYSESGNYVIRAYAVDNQQQESAVGERTVNIGGAPAGTPSPGTPPGTSPGISQYFEIENPLKYGTFEAIVGAISKFLFNIGLALASVMLVIAGFMYVTSAGDPNRVGTAKKLVLYTLIGLAIILLASGLIKVLESILGVTGT